MNKFMSWGYKKQYQLGYSDGFQEGYRYGLAREELPNTIPVPTINQEQRTYGHL